MQIERAPIDVKLESYGSITQIKTAWEVSRPADIDPQIGNILKMDVPVNEFLNLHFTATAPIVVREIICSLRNHVVWARSSRVDDLTNWKVWEQVTNEQMDELLAKHDKMMQEMNSRHQDDFRRLLPLAYMTTFSFQMSLRDFVKLAIWSDREGVVVMKNFCRCCVLAINAGAVPLLGEWIDRLIANRSYSVGDLLPMPELNSNYAKFGAFIGVSTTITLGLRAQLIRHRAISFADNFSWYIDNDCLTRDMTWTLQTEIIMHRDFALQLVRKRSCWIAQTDLWAPIINRLTSAIGGERALPCHDGQCRFKRDNDLRKAGKDPSPPCPVAAKLNNEKLTPAQSVAAFEYAKNRPSVQFWNKEILDAS